MAGPKLEMALQGLQDAINELDSTILTTASKFRDTASETASADSGLASGNGAGRITGLAANDKSG